MWYGIYKCSIWPHCTCSMQIRQLFVSDAEPSYFVQYCCHWLLPALVLRGDSSNLSWVAKVWAYSDIYLIFITRGWEPLISAWYQVSLLNTWVSRMSLFNIYISYNCCVLYIACWLCWCLVFFIYLLKNIFPCKFVIEFDGCLIPGCLPTVGSSGKKSLCSNLCYLYGTALQ